jgi:hypothetical protein
MRRTATILLVLAGAVGAKEENLLPDGDWATRSLSGQATFEKVRGKRRRSKALKVTRPARFGKVEAAWRDFTLPRGKRDGQIRVTALVRGEKLGNAWLRCILWDDAGEDLGTTDINGNTALHGTFKWTEIERVLDLPAGVAKGRILLHVFAGETLWIDDVRIEHVPPKGGKKRGGLELENGDFERSKSGWRKLPSPASDLRVALDRRVRATGKGALRLERKGDRFLPQEGVAADVPDVGRVRRVTLHVAARCEGGARAVAVLLAFDKRDRFLGSARTVVAEPADAFKEARVELKLPPHTRALTVALALEGAGRVWFDDVALEGK